LVEALEMGFDRGLGHDERFRDLWNAPHLNDRK
jgi:hypothetical protein